MKNFPDQKNGEELPEYILRTWKASLELRQEFSNDLSTYECYAKAMAAGQVKIL